MFISLLNMGIFQIIQTDICGGVALVYRIAIAECINKV